MAVTRYESYSHAMGRPMCTRCDRPESVCLCSALPDSPLEHNTRVVLVVHPHEGKQRMRTGNLLPHVLSNVTTSELSFLLNNTREDINGMIG